MLFVSKQMQTFRYHWRNNVIIH